MTLPIDGPNPEIRNENNPTINIIIDPNTQALATKVQKSTKKPDSQVKKVDYYPEPHSKISYEKASEFLKKTVQKISELSKDIPHISKKRVIDLQKGIKLSEQEIKKLQSLTPESSSIETENQIKEIIQETINQHLELIEKLTNKLNQLTQDQIHRSPQNLEKRVEKQPKTQVNQEAKQNLVHYPPNVYAIANFAKLSYHGINTIKENLEKQNSGELLANIKWSESQIANLESRLGRKQPYKELVDNCIQKIIKNHLTLISQLKDQIQKARPPLIASKIKDESLIGIFSRAISSFFKKFINCFPVFKDQQPINHNLERLNLLLGKYQHISEEDLHTIQDLFSDPIFIKTLKKNSSKFDCEQPIAIFNQLIEQLSIIRNEQLKKLKQGQNSLKEHDFIKNQDEFLIQNSFNKISSLINTTGSLASSYQNDALEAKKNSETGKAESYEEAANILFKMQKIFVALRDSSLVSNNQLAIDNLYTPEMLEKIKQQFSPHDSFENKILSQTDSGAVSRMSNNLIVDDMHDGFLKPDLQRNYWSKAEWQDIKYNKDKAFVRGFRKVIIQTPDKKHQIESGALLDLSPLGDLNEKEVALIFFYITRYAESSKIPSKDEKGNPVFLEDEELTNDLNKTMSKLVFDHEQRLELINIVENFNQKLMNATTLAIISIGHKENEPISNNIEEI